MMRSRWSWLLGCAVGVVGATAFAADPCVKPAARPTQALQEAIAQDDAMAAAFDAAALACTNPGQACDDARLKCGNLLTNTLQKQVTFDEGMWLRDMLLAYGGQQYKMTAPIPVGTPLTDVSCNADGVTLKAASQRRVTQANRRRLILSEYPKWSLWQQQSFQTCQATAAADAARAAEQAANAAKLLAAAEAAKQAEQLRQEQARQKLEAEQKAKEDAMRAKAKAEEEARDRAEQAAREKREAEEKAKRERETAAERQQREAEERAEAQKRAQEEAAEKARREKEAAEEARIVAARENAKLTAEQRQAALLEKEKAREQDAEAAAAAQLAALEAAEEKRRLEAKKAIDEAGKVDRSDERQNGSIGVHVMGGIFGIGPIGGMIGGQLRIHQGFWATAPAHGLSSGVELRGSALLMQSVGGSAFAQVISLQPELRYWFGRLALGAAFEYQLLTTQPDPASARHAQSILGLGPTLSLAAVDEPSGRFLITVRYMPAIVPANQFERVTGEFEIGYSYFSAAVQGGLIKDTVDSAAPRLGWFVGLGLGARLFW